MTGITRAGAACDPVTMLITQTESNINVPSHAFRCGTSRYTSQEESYTYDATGRIFFGTLQVGTVTSAGVNIDYMLAGYRFAFIINGASFEEAAALNGTFLGQVQKL